ncbi:Rieske (2Fe-2S) protein [Dasania sp. GY-MA-18]|uniref:Rieske (2Fe-2S) protein n=1 Tax=Dasania phycosphaerae TaxID=2950436 RepID=A0A9J6RH39_9GAMM|nr:MULTISPECIES: Rieske (2Fe-2S) protein [Dasania]MCR8921230.1 Rieske (2Fe-2S) protein [Dasania sp. GY-MA-18]MCZ0863658.1 Rieske (2Fe-2S) protein [Dasania phycosphaerae]MCZ0867386.1 Rieske (2Fe-2S) protein [Dasania phycosphaerae]
MPKLCHIDDIADDSSKGFELKDGSIFAVKKDGQLFVYKNSCPHLGVELNWQEDQFLDMDNTLIQCSTHGALFLIEDGQCVAGPCMGEYLQPVDYHLEDGVITVSSL